MEADAPVDAQNAPTAAWKTLRVFHEFPQSPFPIKSPTKNPEQPPKMGWEIRIDPFFQVAQELLAETRIEAYTVSLIDTFDRESMKEVLLLPERPVEE